MKKIGQLMKEIGFSPNSADSAKEAFLKYLIKQSTGINVQTPTEKTLIKENPKNILGFPKQLEFDFLETKTEFRKKA